MALVVNDRVKETSTTTGTGTFDLTGAVSGFESFVTGIGNSNTTYYAIVNENGEFEVGLGTVTDADPDTLSRDTIISSSNSDSAVNFGAGTKNVFCTLPASKAVIEDSSSNVTLPADLSVGDDLTVEGGVIDFKSNSGSPAALRMYCEVSNAHFQTLEPQPHSAAASNTLRLPDSGDSGTQDLVAVDTTQTLTNKTLTSPVLNTSLSGTAFLDEDNMSSNAADKVASQQSIKAYVDTEIAGVPQGDITSVTAGTGLTGGGTTGDVTLNVGAGNLIDVQADQIDVDLSELTTSTSDADGDFFAVVDSANAQKKLTKGNINISGFNNDSGFIDGSSLNASNLDSGTVPNARLSSIPNSALANSAITINGSSTSLGGSINVGDITGVTAGTLLDGGGTTGTVTLNVDLSELTTSTSNGDGDFFAVIDSANAQKKLTKGNINISGFNNDSGFTTNTGTVTSVSGGNGLTGSVTTSGSLAVGAGTGIDVTADAVAVDVSDFMSNGSNNRVVTATGTDAMNAEANMTFDGSTLDVTGAIRATGDVTAFYSSDKNLKENISNIENSLDKVSKLNGVYYNWTKEAQEKHSHFGEEKEVGVIAQDVEAVLPEIVATREDGTKAVRYERLCAVLIESIKELKKEIEELKSGV